MSPADADHNLSKYWLQAQAAVASYVACMVPDFHDAEDVMQSVASAVIDKFDTYDPDRPFVAWAIGIARYEVLNYRRKNKNDRHIFSEAAMSRIENAYAVVDPDIDRYRIALHHCIAGLAERGRKLIEMRYLHGLKSGRIAKRVGMTPAAVSAMLYRVRGSLRNCMDARLRDEGGDA